MNAQSFDRPQRNGNNDADVQVVEEGWEGLPAVKRHLYFYAILVLVAVALHTYLSF
jgi:hypothetical protein